MKDRFERLRLSRPIDGRFGDIPVDVIEIGTLSARGTVHGHVDDATRARLRFDWNGTAYEVDADVDASRPPLAIFHFVDRTEALTLAVENSARELAAAQLANAIGAREANVFDGDLTLTAASAGSRASLGKYLTLTLSHDGWRRRASLVPDQPDDGFTVSAAESEEQIAMLCETYEHGDEETRSLTRTLAAMSISGAPAIC